MKKRLWVLFFLFLIIVGGVWRFNVTNDKKDTYLAERTVTESQNGSENKKSKNVDKKNEEIISEFSTRLPNDTKSRDDNIKLGCRMLDGTIVKAGKVFSFWDNIGITTKERGYKEAKAFNSDGEVIQSYGGGVCQISTTIYNAVLQVKELKIIERHEHSRKVSYIEDGKDAAVSYNTADFKFENTFNYDIKIYAKVEDRKVKIRLIRI